MEVLSSGGDRERERERERDGQTDRAIEREGMVGKAGETAAT